jgi:ribosomal protein L7/L12
MSDIDQQRVHQLEQRLALVESKLDAITAALNINITVQAPPVDPLTAELRQLVAAGRTIDAIKRLREVTGMGLAEAKAQVEALG